MTAAAVTAPGSGRWIAASAGAAGTFCIAAVIAGLARGAHRIRRSGCRAAKADQPGYRFRHSSAPAPRAGIALRALRYTAVLSAVLLLLGVQIDLAEQRRADPLLTKAAARGVTLEMRAVLDGYPERSKSIAGERISVRASVTGSHGPVPVLLWCDESEAEDSAAWGPGTRLNVRGGPVVLEASSTAAFGVRVERVIDSGGDWRSTVAAGTTGLRRGLVNASAVQLGGELVPGMAVGDTSLVDDELENLMIASSLLHLVAVSGANCALVTTALMWGAGWCGVPRRGRILLAALGLAGFVVVVGPDASVRRAAVMATVMLVSSYGGKRAVALASLGVAILALLISDPWQALNAGFALSVAATAGILLLASPIRSTLQHWTRAPAWLLLPIALACAAQAACGPLLLLLQPGIPAVGLLANVIAGPAAPAGTALGLLTLLVIPLQGEAGALLARLASVPARWVAATAEVTAGLPLGRWDWPQGWGGALLLAAVEIAFALAWLLLTSRLRLGSALRDHGGLRPWVGRLPRPLRLRVAVALLLCGALGVFLGPTLVVPLATRVGTPQGWAVVACDVGQGDAILLRDPSAPSQIMLVDTGDDPTRLAACLDRFGVDRVSLLVLTHDDRDHVGALQSVIGRVDAALVSPDNLEDGDNRPVLHQLATAGVPFEVGSAGMTGMLGAPRAAGAAQPSVNAPQGLRWRVLAPTASERPTDTNGASLVLMADAGMTSVLLLADTGAEQHARLLRSVRVAAGADGAGPASARAADSASSTSLRADILKVAHHGSRDASAELMHEVGASYGLISVGTENSYGHPAAETLDRLAGAGTTALRTDILGSIALSPGNDPVDHAPGVAGSRRDDLEVWVERGE